MKNIKVYKNNVANKHLKELINKYITITLRRKAIKLTQLLLISMLILALITPISTKPQPTIKLVKLWDKNLGSIIHSIAWSPDGTKIAVGTEDGFLYIFNNTGKLLWNEKLNLGVEGVSWSPDGSLLAACGKFGKVVVYTSLGVHVGETEQLGYNVLSVSWSPENMYLVAAGDKVIKYAIPVRALGGSLSKVWEVDPPGYVYSIAWSPDGHVIALGTGYFSGGWHGKVYLF